jgi:hypothetical protein
MTAPEDAILARRRLTNKLIAARDAARLRPFFAPDIKLIAGGGDLLTGVETVIEAFATQFADPAFITYVRTADSVQLDAARDHAAEAGRWVAHWKTGEITGTYLAAWRKAAGQWVIESELYITLS